MRITRTEGHHCIVLTDAEAECLVDACALVVIAGQSDPRATLPPQMGALLCTLFETLSKPAAAGALESSGILRQTPMSD
jgi:hypothetical protein